MELERIRVEGMSCGHCVARVKAALEELDGVEVEAVEIGEAAVWRDPTVEHDRVTEAIRSAGYTPK